jgi:hypothetical protein
MVKTPQRKAKQKPEGELEGAKTTAASEAF